MDSRKDSRATKPSPAANEFGDTSILVPLFDRHRGITIERAKHLAADDLSKAVPNPTPRYNTIGEMLLFMSLHVGMHMGQISSIRRSLGRAPLV